MKPDYVLFVSKKIEVVGGTVEENGLVDNNCFISVFKKDENNIIRTNKIHNDVVINDNNEVNVNNKIKNKTNIKIKGEHISLCFKYTVGSNVLVGEDSGKLCEAVRQMVSGDWKKCALPDRWDGRTAERIVQIILAP